MVGHIYSKDKVEEVVDRTPALKSTITESYNGGTVEKKTTMDGSLENIKTVDASVGSTKAINISLEGSVAVAADVSGEGTNEMDESLRKASMTSGSVENDNGLVGAVEISSNINSSVGNVDDRDASGSITCLDGSLNTGNVDELVKVASEATENLQLEPKVGMVFHSEEEAYEFYNSYAKRKGFSVRKGHLSRRRDNSIRDRHYVCSNEGTRQEHRTHVTKKPRPLERTKCLARIEFKVNRSNVWVVNKLIEEHNHLLASPNKIHMLRSHRKKLPVERAIFTEADYYYGVKPSLMYDSQSEEVQSMGDGELLVKNQNSCLSATRLRDLEKGDAQFLLDILKNKQSEDPSFFYAVQIDEKERMTNFFWADARKLPLPKFIAQYFKALVQLREKELFEDYESRQTKPVLLVDIPVLAEAAESYTRTIYVDFEYEYKSQLACLCETIAMDGTRWTKYAKDGTLASGPLLAADSSAQESLISRYSRICHKAVSVAGREEFSLLTKPKEVDPLEVIKEADPLEAIFIPYFPHFFCFFRLFHDKTLRGLIIWYQSDDPWRFRCNFASTLLLSLSTVIAALSANNCCRHYSLAVTSSAVTHFCVRPFGEPISAAAPASRERLSSLPSSLPALVATAAASTLLLGNDDGSNRRGPTISAVAPACHHNNTDALD
ncbi:FAR1 DNA-binding domain [Musa troglodytarum]|uniref:FAR1 DNA-binding domain n=1 Tax=Musa troglodytarum TaxID=320322 RepID=A0A9E7HM55_9LILI|nr:FAR1 DNA-binding domain [Musa troglodytarum]